MTANRGFGLLPDPTSYDGFGLAPRYRRSSVPSRYDLSDHCELGWDQGGTNACVAFAIAQQLLVLGRYAGLDLPEMSKGAAYYHARLGLVPTRPDGTLTQDDGCYPSRCYAKLLQYGIPDESRWNWTEGSVNSMPPWDVWQAATEQDWLSVQPLRSQGSDLCNDIRSLISSGIPVCVGVECDDAFMDHDPQDGPWTRLLPSLGRHYLCAVRYDLSGLWVLNSWGRSWGQDGYGLLSWREVCVECSNINAAFVKGLE